MVNIHKQPNKYTFFLFINYNNMLSLSSFLKKKL